MELPPSPDPETCEALRHDAAWVAQVCAHFEATLGLAGPGMPFPTESAVVARFGDKVLKLFFPMQRRDAKRESEVLVHLHGTLPVDTPELLDQGEASGWPYLVISRLEGQDLSQVADTLSSRDKQGLAEQLGEVLRTLHEQPPLGAHALNWGLWTQVQTHGAIDQHRQGRCPGDLLAQLPAWLERADLSMGPRGFGMLHGEVRPEHLRVRRSGKRWQICGLVDFSPAMVGPVDLEFATVGLFVTRGDRALLSTVLESYGLAPRDSALTRRLFALALIHRVGDLGGWLRAAALNEPRDLDALADHWFGLPD